MPAAPTGRRFFDGTSKGIGRTVAFAKTVFTWDDGGVLGRILDAMQASGISSENVNVETLAAS